MADKPQGPGAAYFPAIEAKYGRSIADWKADMRATGLSTHKELVAWLKDEHGFGHGHAAAITASLLHEGAAPVAVDDQVADMFTAKKAHWRPVYDRIVATIDSLGDVTALPKKGKVGFAAANAKGQFAVVAPSTPDRFDIGLKLPGIAPSARLAPANGWYSTMTHRIQLTSPTQLDEELLTWLTQAYTASTPS